MKVSPCEKVFITPEEASILLGGMDINKIRRMCRAKEKGINVDFPSVPREGKERSIYISYSGLLEWGKKRKGRL